MTEIATIKWEVGAHTQFCKNITDTLKKSIYLGMNVSQFFLGSPKSFKRHRASLEDIITAQRLLDRFPTHIFSHFPYVANFAGSVKSLAWNGDEEQDGKTLLILKELEYELGVISNFFQKGSKRSGVVIHPGNYKDKKLGLSTIAKTINRINFPEGSKLLLENAAGQGCTLCTTFEEIKELYDQILPEKQKYVGVCVDTAHIYGYGEYDLSKVVEIDRMFREFNDTIGLDKLILLHLNDSKVPFGSKKDEHALLGTGYIWSNDNLSLIHLLDTCLANSIPVMLETSYSDMFILGMLSGRVC